VGPETHRAKFESGGWHGHRMVGGHVVGGAGKPMATQPWPCHPAVPATPWDLSAGPPVGRGADRRPRAGPLARLTRISRQSRVLPL